MFLWFFFVQKPMAYKYDEINYTVCNNVEIHAKCVNM